MEEVQILTEKVHEEEKKDDKPKSKVQQDLDNEKEVNKDKPFCRFCWTNDRSLENPLISACKCSGGVRFIHFECLRQWLKTKMQISFCGNVKNYLFHNFSCEICRHSYSTCYNAHGRRFCLVDINIPDSDYMILETMDFEKNTGRTISVLAIMLNGRP